MKILLHHRTTNCELKIGQRVCYKDKNGEYTRFGTIDNIRVEDCVTLYEVNKAEYVACELKLIVE